MRASKFGFWPEVGSRLSANASEAEPARADSRYPKPINRTRIHELQLWIFRRRIQIIGIVVAFLSRAPRQGERNRCKYVTIWIRVPLFARRSRPKFWLTRQII